MVWEVKDGVAGPSRSVRFNEPELWQLVGNTPLLDITPADLAGDNRKLLLKAEWLNPGGSVKDRAAVEILREGFELGELPGKRLLDASSGNTAVAYAMLGAAAGAGVTVCVPRNASDERKRLLGAYGAELIETDPLEGSDGAIREAAALAARHPERYWYADQYNNPRNPEAHEKTTGPEIVKQTGGRVTHLVAGVGTGGTLSGTGRFLKGRDTAVTVVSVEPSEPFHGLEGLKHLETACVPGNYDPSVVDEKRFVPTEQAERMTRRLAREAGLLAGWSTGAAVAAAQDVLATAPRGSVVVVIGPDGGTRYLSESRRWQWAG